VAIRHTQINAVFFLLLLIQFGFWFPFLVLIPDLAV